MAGGACDALQGLGAATAAGAAVRRQGALRRSAAGAAAASVGGIAAQRSREACWRYGTREGVDHAALQTSIIALIFGLIFRRSGRRGRYAGG